MYWNRVIELIGYQKIEDDYGNVVNSSPIIRKIYCNEWEERLNPTYNDPQSKFKVTYQIEIRREEYKGEERCNYLDDKGLYIINTVKKGTKIVLMIGEKIA